MRNAEITRTVLLVEDERGLHRAYRRFFMGIGFHVVSAHSGIQAVAAVREFGRQIDFILLDMMLPDMCGRDVLQALNSEGLIPATPVIVMTAAIWSPVERDRLRELGARDVVQKNDLSLDMLASYTHPPHGRTVGVGQLP